MSLTFPILANRLESFSKYMLEPKGLFGRSTVLRCSIELGCEGPGT